MKKIKPILIVICVIGLLISGYQLISYTKESKEVVNTYEELFIEVNENNEVSTSSFPIINFNDLENKNEDIIGWIILNDSPINYPVVQTTDNDYYLNKLYDKTNSSHGSIFMDCRNQKDLSNHHTIIYGHHMKDGTMFSKIVKLSNQDYYDEHKELMYLTKDTNYTIKIFSAYLTNSLEDGYRISFENEEDYSNWLKNELEKSKVKTDVIPTSKDYVITLSTCGFDFENARYIAHGVLVKE